MIKIRLIIVFFLLLQQNDLIPLFSHYGYIVEIRMQPERGFAFVKLDTHENAASAIVNLAGQVACGRPIKCGWGKDRNESAMLGALRQGMQLGGYGSVVSLRGSRGAKRINIEQIYIAGYVRHASVWLSRWLYLP